MRLTTVLLILVATAALAPSALASEKPGAAIDDEVESVAAAGAEEKPRFALTLYLWAISMKGAAGVANQDIDVDLPFSDAVKKLDGVFMLRFETWFPSRWGVIVDIASLSLKDDAESGPIKVEAELSQFDAELGAGYRFLDGEPGGPDDVTIDALAGIRFSRLDQELGFERLPDISIDEAWFTPWIGARFAWRFAEDWALIVRGDVGGFGISGSADIDAKIIAGVAWQVSELIRLSLGYAARRLEYGNGSGKDRFSWKVTYQGPLFALSFTF